MPWKTASQSLRARLSHIDESPYPKFFYFNSHLNRVVHQHLTLADFLAIPESRQGHRLAVFVRNPYDRVFSGFKQLLRDVASQPAWLNFPNPWIRDLVTQQLADNFSLLCKAQFNVNKWFQQLPKYQLVEAGRDSSLPLYPAHYWTHVQNRQVADFIGRVEHFENDFEVLCQLFGIENAGNQTLNQSGDVNAELDVQGYRYIHRLQPQTITRINEVFSDDFDLLGYKKIQPKIG